MPVNAMLAGSNSMLNAQSLPKLLEEFPDEVEALGQPGTLADVARRVLGLGDDEYDYLAAIPHAVSEGIRAAIVGALTSDPVKSVNMAYSPGYEFEASIVDFGQAVTIHIKGPYESISPGEVYRKRKTRTTAKRATAARTTAKRSRKRGR